MKVLLIWLALWFVKLVLGWAAMCGLVWLVSLCFGWEFSWAIATGVWLIWVAVGSLVRKIGKK